MTNNLCENWCKIFLKLRFQLTKEILLNWTLNLVKNRSAAKVPLIWESLERDSIVLVYWLWSEVLYNISIFHALFSICASSDAPDGFLRLAVMPMVQHAVIDSLWVNFVSVRTQPIGWCTLRNCFSVWEPPRGKTTLLVIIHHSLLQFSCWRIPLLNIHAPRMDPLASMGKYYTIILKALLSWCLCWERYSCVLRRRLQLQECKGRRASFEQVPGPTFGLDWLTGQVIWSHSTGRGRYNRNRYRQWGTTIRERVKLDSGIRRH